MAGTGDVVGLSSGDARLDELLGGGLAPGDNVALFAEDLDAGTAMAAAFARQDAATCAWITLGREPSGGVPDGVEVFPLGMDATAGDPDAVVSAIIEIAERHPRLVIDGLGAVAVEHGPTAAGDLYRQCCPRLFNMGAVAVWPIVHGALPAAVATKITRIAQCVFELRADVLRIVKAEGRPMNVQGAVAELTWDGESRTPRIGRELIVGRLGEGLRRLRRDRSLTQRELALIAGVTPGAISQAEAGRRGLSLETLVPMCDRLGVSVDEVLGTRRRAHHLLARRDRRPIGMDTTALFDAHEGPMRVYRMELEPRDVGVPPFVHKGTELVLVSRGLVLVDLGDDTPVMRAGDALMAIDDRIIKWTNLDADTSELFWIAIGNERYGNSGDEWSVDGADPEATPRSL